MVHIVDARWTIGKVPWLILVASLMPSVYGTQNWRWMPNDNIDIYRYSVNQPLAAGYVCLSIDSPVFTWLQVINEDYSQFSWVAWLITVFIVVSITVSYTIAITSICQTGEWSCIPSFTSCHGKIVVKITNIYMRSAKFNCWVFSSFAPLQQKIWRS